MIHEVKINFQRSLKFEDGTSSGQLLDDNRDVHQTLTSIISDLNGRQENYCIVLQVVYGLSLSDKPQRTTFHSLIQGLTKRELEIFDLAIKGLSNKLISEQLFISVETVKSHRKSIVNKAGVSRIEEIKNWLLNENFDSAIQKSLLGGMSESSK